MEFWKVPRLHHALQVGRSSRFYSSYFSSPSLWSLPVHLRLFYSTLNRLGPLLIHNRHTTTRGTGLKHACKLKLCIILTIQSSLRPGFDPASSSLDIQCFVTCSSICSPKCLTSCARAIPLRHQMCHDRGVSRRRPYLDSVGVSRRWTHH